MRQTSFVVFLLAVFFASLALAQSTSSKASKKTPAKKAITKNGAKKGKASSKTAKSAPVAAYRQMTPTPERYKEIQQALVDKGYLKSEPNGVWDAESSAALAQFQNDRKLSPTGKLSSASLIALGLGPGTAPIPPASGAGTPGQPTPAPTPSN
jgi:hypothetical protein